jgi:hypothetical protein
MICPSCDGRPNFPPCPTCYGSGIAYCCEGECCEATVAKTPAARGDAAKRANAKDEKVAEVPRSPRQ